MKFKVDFPPTDKQLENHEKEGLSWFDSYVLQNEKFKIPKTTFPRPFMVQMKDNQYGILKENNLYITNQEDFDDVKDAFYNYELVTKEMDSRTNNGNHYDPIHVDYIRDTLSKINKIFEKSEKIGPDLISTNNFKKDPEKMYEEFRDYLVLLEESNKEKIEDYFNLKFDLLSMKEQFYFLNLIKDKNSDEIIPIKNFTDKFSTNGFRTFLSIEQGDESGETKIADKILTLGDSEKFPEEAAKVLFAKYGEIIDGVNKIIISLEEKLNDKSSINLSSEMAVRDNLLKRGKNLLEKYADNLKKDPNEIISELNNLKVDNIIFLSIFQSLHDTKDVKFEDLKDFEFFNHWIVTEQEEKEITEIINKNYKNAPDELRKKVLDSFLSSINGIQGGYDDIDIYQLKHQGKVVACCKLDYKYYEEDYGKKVYFGSFNVDPDFANGEIGTAMLERTVDKVAKDYLIEADCSAFSKIGARYIETGFVAEDFYDFNGWPSFRIIRDDNNKEKIIGKNISTQEIIYASSYGFLEKDGKRVEIVSSIDPKDFISQFNEIKNKDKIVSRYFFDKDTNKWFIVLEKTN